MISFIVTLAFIAFIAFKLYKSTRTPKGLENMPTVSFWGALISTLTKAGPHERWEETREIFEKEGIVKVWLGRWNVNVTDLELVKDILTKTDLYPKVMSGKRNPRSVMNQYLGVNLVLSSGDVWKRHRRVANPAFRNIPIKPFAEVAVKLMDVMEKVDNKPIDAEQLMRRTALDVLGKAQFGFDFNSLGDPNNAYATAYTEVIKETLKLIFFIVPALNYIPRPEANEKIAKLHNLLDDIVESKSESIKTGELDKRIDNNTADLLDYMIHASNDPENPTLTKEELRYNMAMFMFAGHDTTANALTTTLYLLAIHKDAQQKVRDEIFQVLGDDLIPSIEQQKELKYMNMVIYENLRLHPPILYLTERYTSQSVKYRNHVIPADTYVLLNVYGIHHSSKNWEKPDEFIPERFKNENHDQFAWMSFGGGSRLCIGNNFSLIEQRVILCSILRKYEISLPTDSIHKDKIQIENRGGALGVHPMHLIFKRRAD